jgi:hypothetical protein
MGKFDVPDTKATLCMDIVGLAACCFNADYKDSVRKGRWEVAFPRFDDHLLTLTFGNTVVRVLPSVKKIEIKDRTGVDVSNPRYEVSGRFTRDDITKFVNDFRWVTGFTDPYDFPHGKVTVDPKIDVTIAYIYDSTFYTPTFPGKPNIMVRATQDQTGQVIRGKVFSVPDYQAGPVLDKADALGFIASSVAVDVHSYEIGKGIVDIIFDDDHRITINQTDGPRDLAIENMEPPRKQDEPVVPDEEGSVFKTATNEYGRGDLYRYYELFKVEGQKFHVWEKKARQSGLASSARTGDCNAVRVDLPHLGELSE